MKKIIIGLPNATGDTKNEWSAMLAGICVQLALKGYQVDTICIDGSFTPSRKVGVGVRAARGRVGVEG